MSRTFENVICLEGLITMGPLWFSPHNVGLCTTSNFGFLSSWHPIDNVHGCCGFCLSPACFLKSHQCLAELCQKTMTTFCQTFHIQVGWGIKHTLKYYLWYVNIWKSKKIFFLPVNFQQNLLLADNFYHVSVMEIYLKYAWFGGTWYIGWQKPFQNLF